MSLIRNNYFALFSLSLLPRQNPSSNDGLQAPWLLRQLDKPTPKKYRDTQGLDRPMEDHKRTEKDGFAVHESKEVRAIWKRADINSVIGHCNYNNYNNYSEKWTPS